MQHGLKLQHYKITSLRNSQRGYMLITLMLALALIAIGLLTVLPEIGQQLRRDREEEMRHRGTAYMRAIQHFYKKFGRYPMRVEELENTNNLRFLRKRYTDPINRDPATGKEKDFKLLRQTDISLNNGPVLGQVPGQNLLPGQTAPQGQGTFGAQPGGGQPTGSPGAQNPASGDPDDPSSGNPSSGNPASGNPASGDLSSGKSSSGKSPSGDSSDAEGNSNSSGTPSSNPGFNGPTLGGGPILGVASTSKAKSIRVFYEKNHYKDWLFIYVPQGNRGGLLTGPVSLNGPTGNLGGVAPGVQGTPPNASQPQGIPTQPPQSPNPGQAPPEE